LGVLVVARKPESLVREVLERRFEIRFTDVSFNLGDWGRTDGKATLSDHTYLLLEVESMQKHPSTNVLKIWPFLEENKGLSVLLVHAFFPDSPGRENSRGKLASWLVPRMHEILGYRFEYCRIVIDRDGKPREGFRELQEALDKMRHIRAQ
jgi:hypothetical protein